jgi:peroxiredoxin Q/BCP
MSEVQSGSKAPNFTLPDNQGQDLSLESLAGQNVVLYFYPKDDSPGCTKEAIGFSEHIEAFAAANTVVIGISKDTVAKHGKFRDKHGLKVRLVSDAENQVTESYGAWVEKKMYGKTYMGIERCTFLVGADGEVKQVWRKVKVPGHVEAVLDAVQAL